MSADAPDAAADALLLSKGFEIAPGEAGRWTLTFQGEGAVPLAACRALVRRLERDAPVGVQLLCDFASPGAAWAEALAGIQLPSIRAFIFDTHFQTQARQGENSIGDLSATLGACPSLERLFATGRLGLTACAHESLRELMLLGEPLTPGLLAALGGCRFPRLERLVLSLASDAQPSPERAVAAALKGLRAPQLREISIERVGDLPAFLATIAEAGLEPSWKVLALTGSLDEDELQAAIERHAPSLRSLEALRLPLADEASSEAGDRLRAVLPQVGESSEGRSRALPEAYERWPS